MNEELQHIGINLGFRNSTEVLVDIEALDGVEAADYAFPACLHDVLVRVAAEIDLDTMIASIAAISGVDQAYRV